jgi:hypothetical protein
MGQTNLPKADGGEEDTGRDLLAFGEDINVNDIPF